MKLNPKLYQISAIVQFKMFYLFTSKINILVCDVLKLNLKKKYYVFCHHCFYCCYRRLRAPFKPILFYKIVQFRGSKNTSCGLPFICTVFVNQNLRKVTNILSICTARHMWIIFWKLYANWDNLVIYVIFSAQYCCCCCGKREIRCAARHNNYEMKYARVHACAMRTIYSYNIYGILQSTIKSCTQNYLHIIIIKRHIHIVL